MKFKHMYFQYEPSAKLRQELAGKGISSAKSFEHVQELADWACIVCDADNGWMAFENFDDACAWENQR